MIESLESHDRWQPQPQRHAVVCSRHVPPHAVVLPDAAITVSGMGRQHAMVDPQTSHDIFAHTGVIHNTMLYCTAVHITSCGKGGMLKVRASPWLCKLYSAQTRWSQQLGKLYNVAFLASICQAAEACEM